MLATVRCAIPLLISTVFLLMGVALLHTLVALRGGALGFSVAMIGTLTAAYYTGFLGGTYAIPRMVHRIGQIRAFAFCTTLVVVSVMVQLIAPNFWVWLAMRVLQGLLLVGLYIIIESWLNAAAEPAHRTRLFSIYMMLNLGAGAVAQQLLHIPGQDFVLFCVVAILFCLASLPVIDMRQRQPQLQSMPRPEVVRSFRLVPTALVSALVSGLVLGALWGLLPVYAAARGMSPAQVGTYVSVAIFGGVALQWPLGHFADRIDRRLALAVISAAAAIAALAQLSFSAAGAAVGLALIFAFGGMSFALYPIAVAHLVDYLRRDELLSASATLLLVNGIGSAVGPLVAGNLMNRGQPQLLFAWFSALSALLAAYALYRFVRRKRDVQPADHFVPLVTTTAETLDPRSKPEASTIGTAEDQDDRLGPVLQLHAQEH